MLYTSLLASIEASGTLGNLVAEKRGHLILMRSSPLHAPPRLFTLTSASPLISAVEMIQLG